MSLFLSIINRPGQYRLFLALWLAYALANGIGTDRVPLATEKIFCPSYWQAAEDAQIFSKSQSLSDDSESAKLRHSIFFLMGPKWASMNVW